MTGGFVWTDDRVRAALGLSAVDAGASGFASDAADGTLRFRGVSTDSRTAGEGDLFVALEGDNFDGHDYVIAALERGAKGAVVSRHVEAEGDARFYPVDDTLHALGCLAGYRRTRLSAAVVGITGSSGKTGTKDLTRAALEGSRTLHSTRGNLNNRVGLPLTLLDAPDDVEVVVLEMGTNEPGEIRTLTEIAGPEIGVVTTVSETHIEKLESLEGVLGEKLDLLRGLPDDGKAVVGDEPSILPDEARRVHPDVRVAGWGDRADDDLRPADATMDDQGHWSFSWHGEPVRLRVPGRHSVLNALLALTVADMLDVPAAEAARGVSTLEASSMRGEIRQLGELTLLLDCYNANPQSTRAALDLLVAMEPERPKVAFLGSMLELGSHSEEIHTALLAEAATMKLDLLVATGDFAGAAEKMTSSTRAPSSIACVDPLEAYEELKNRLNGDEVVLIKASRGFALERVVPEFERDFGVATVPGGPGA
jgi:UDP-N-acetylmuramoyl-tripeptide--D-alanyl-D-alanine ligase